MRGRDVAVERYSTQRLVIGQNHFNCISLTPSTNSPRNTPGQSIVCYIQSQTPATNIECSVRMLLCPQTPFRWFYRQCSVCRLVRLVHMLTNCSRLAAAAENGSIHWLDDIYIYNRSIYDLPTSWYYFRKQINISQTKYRLTDIAFYIFRIFRPPKWHNHGKQWHANVLG